MSYFRKFKHFSNVLIRIPPLFVIDSVLNGTLLKIVYQSVHPDYSVFPITTWAQLFQWLATSFTSQYSYILFCCCLRLYLLIQLSILDQTHHSCITRIFSAEIRTKISFVLKVFFPLILPLLVRE